ncbi:Lpg1974 family pore-forming outer membrane protein [Botrimarina mediterranea]|uniref:Lpg1974 family pore-forming outer membrane protein n=1 Tax=Botrimarina mediterranea TaxID=2528022 RepID=UPI00118A1C6E|nr:hypothetical protein K2D_39380 [Planctomycetes bacterium K2D]
MTILMRGACALLLAAGFVGGVSAQSIDKGAVAAKFDSDMALANAVQQASCDCGPIGDECGTCDLGYCGSGVGGGGQVFVGAEWLSVRGTFSEATAYREYSLANDLETFHQFDMDYGSSYRVFGGYRLCNCGGEVRFTYTNFNSDGGFTSPPNPNDNTDTIYYAPYELALGDGDVVYGRAKVNVDNYDIGFSKTIPLGCPLQSGCGDCCDPCCQPCAAWDITWSGGVRFASVDSSLAYGTTRASTSNVPNRFAESTVNFDGAGLRFGLTGRRYFGRTGVLSAYLRGDISLLLGDVEHGVSGTTFTDTSITTTEVIPVTEIEAGLTGYVTQNLSVSAGYLLSAWHDLGHRTEYNYSVSPSQVYSMDDANMMMFDGFFIRATAAF